MAKAIKKKPAKDQTLLEKVGVQASHIKDEIIEGKDHLIEIAGNAMTSVKSKIQQITHKKKTAKKKSVKKSAKVVNKSKASIKKAKKAAPKKAIKKIAGRKK